jgi:hypothetical protein
MLSTRSRCSLKSETLFAALNLPGVYWLDDRWAIPQRSHRGVGGAQEAWNDGIF